MQPTVLVTGATGFVGRHCLQLLQHLPFAVHAVRHSQAEVAGRVAWHQADLMDPAGVSRLLRDVRPSHLLHLAWTAKPGVFWESDDNLAWVQASLHLVREFVACGGRRLVAAGTCAEYDWNHEVGSEDLTPLAPASLYGTCKRALHSIVDHYLRRQGVSYAWGRVFFPFGPFEHPARLVPSVINSLLANRVARCTAGTQWRDLIYVEDLAAAFVALLEGDLTGAVNLGTGEATTLRQVVQRIGAKLGRDDLLALGALPMRPNEPPRLVADVRRLRAATGWTCRFDLDAALDRTIAWWRHNQGESHAAN